MSDVRFRLKKLMRGLGCVVVSVVVAGVVADPEAGVAVVMDKTGRLDAEAREDDEAELGRADDDVEVLRPDLAELGVYEM